MEYEVGYRKPPKAFQFQKGRSGNVSGRPRKPFGFLDRLAKAGRQKIRVNGKNGPKDQIIDDVICQQLLIKAAGGNLKAIDLYAKLKMIHTPGMVKPEDMEAMASSAKAKLYEMFEASKESEGPAQSDQSSNPANAISSECDRSKDPVEHSVEDNVDFDLVGEDRSARSLDNHPTLNSTSQVPPESVVADASEDSPP
jgi:hypothetical protein